MQMCVCVGGLSIQLGSFPVVFLSNKKGGDAEKLLRNWKAKGRCWNTEKIMAAGHHTLFDLKRVQGKRKMQINCFLH